MRLERPAVPFRRGDANRDGRFDVSDAVATLGFLFLGAPPTLACAKSTDTNGDGALDLSDVVWTLAYLFLGGPEPPPPFPTCGTDPTPERVLGCESFPGCP